MYLQNQALFGQFLLANSFWPIPGQVFYTYSGIWRFLEDFKSSGGAHYIWGLLEDFTSCGGALFGTFEGFYFVWVALFELLKDFTPCGEALFGTFGGLRRVEAHFLELLEEV